MVTRNSLRKKWMILIPYFLMAVFYVWIASQVPYTHDDWDWGLDIGLNHLITADINSRYAGNLFIVIMTRSALAKTVIMGAGYFFVPFLISVFLKKRFHLDAHHQMLCFLIANVLILAMNPEIWKQTYGWASGFANFGISAVFLLWSFIAWLPSPEQDKPGKTAALQCICCFAASLIGQLFIENLTVALLVISIGVNVSYVVRHGKVSWKYITMTLGTLLGTLVMFSSSIYASLLTTGQAVDGYRQLSLQLTNGLKEVVHTLAIQVGTLLINGTEGCAAAAVAVLVMLTLFAYRAYKKEEKRNAIFWCVINLVLIAYNLVAVFAGTLWLSKSMGTAAFSAVVSVIYCLVVTVEIWLLFRTQTAVRSQLLRLWLGAWLIIAPLIVTQESGARIFYTYYVVVVLLVLSMLCCYCKNMPVKAYKRLFVSTVALFGVFAVYYGVIYASIGAVKAQREAIISEAIAAEEQTIILPAYPYGEYLWYPDPSNTIRVPYFKLFYGLPEEVQIIFLSQCNSEN